MVVDFLNKAASVAQIAVNAHGGEVLQGFNSQMINFFLSFISGLASYKSTAVRQEVGAHCWDSAKSCNEGGKSGRPCHAAFGMK